MRKKSSQQTNSSKILSAKPPNGKEIFRVQECLKNVKESMIKEELEYFEKYKNMNWH
jgi:hypothetical protein